MFDLTAGTIDRAFRDSHPAAQFASLTTHVAIIGSVVAVMLYGMAEAPEAPKIMAAFVAEAAAPSPPPPPPAPKIQAARPATATAAPTSSPFAAPIEAPQGVRPETGLDLGGVDGGVEGGVPGGIPGGVLGGLAGTVLSDVPPPPPPKPKRIGGEIQAPALIHRVEPEYPPIAVHSKITGMVILEATVDERGRVQAVTVLRSIPLLDKAAIEAVKQWQYQPLLLNGVAYPFVLTVTLTFSLR